MRPFLVLVLYICMYVVTAVPTGKDREMESLSPSRNFSKLYGPVTMRCSDKYCCPYYETCSKDGDKCISRGREHQAWMC